MKRSRYSPCSASMICSSRCGAQRGDDQRLRLAAREQRRAVGTRQHAGADRRSDARCACRGRRCAARRSGSADGRSSLRCRTGCCRLVRRVGAAHRPARHALDRPWRVRVDFLQLRVARLLRSAAGRRRAGRFRRCRRPWRSALRPSARRFQSHTGLPPSSTSSWIASIAACICSWPNTTAPSITSSGSSLGFRFHHQHGGFGAGDDQVERRFVQLRSCVGFSTYWPLM